MNRRGFLCVVVALIPAWARADVAIPAGIRIAEAARQQLGVTRDYDPSYVRLDYPGGDVPESTGVCADVVIRALRVALALDLQRAVHEDMRTAFEAYPRAWGLKRPDRNIDHRRVLNLETWFQRQGWSLPLSREAEDWQPGDLVSWRLDSGAPHIGVVSTRRVAGSTRRLCVHNIAFGAREEDVLFGFALAGRFRIPERTR